MKLKYFIPAFFALFALALTSCNDDDAPTMFKEIQVSSSNVFLPEGGGSTSIAVKSTDTWAIDVEEMPEWLSANPMTGPAGQTAVTFTAEPSNGVRTAVIHIVCAGKRQTINIQQGQASVTVATCAEVIAGPESKTYRVTGTVSAIANTSYGNWYLTDETGTIYIYGTLDKNGNAGANNSIAIWGIEVGDQITVEGPKTLYGTTVELVNVTVISLQKSLIKVEGYDPESATFDKEGGNVTVNLSCKTANGVSVAIPEEAKDWLSMVSITGGAEPTVTFHATPNEGGVRSAAVTFTTTDDKGKEYTAVATLTQNGGIVEVTVAEFLAAEVGDAQYRMTGVITGLYSSDNQGKSFYIRDYSGEVLVYRAEGFLDNAKVGDVVTIMGQRGAYRDNPQMVSGTVENVIPVTPVTIDEFLAKEDNAEVYYMVSGTLDEIVNPTYGNLWLKDGDSRLYVYGCYPGWGATGDNRKNYLETAGIVVGDRLTVIGVKSTYQGQPQVANGIYFSHVPAN